MFLLKYRHTQGTVSADIMNMLNGSRVIASIIGVSATIALSACSTGGLSEEQQALEAAGPYVVEASDNVLQACSTLSSLRTRILESQLFLEVPTDNRTIQSEVVGSLSQAFDAYEMSDRYGEVYAAIYSVDGALLNSDFEAVVVLLEDVIDECSTITIIDNDELRERGIEIEPGNIPNIAG